MGALELASSRIQLECGGSKKSLSIVYSAECKAIQKANRSTGMLPLLVVLFVFSYAILTALVFEQGKTIESQRGLIKEMLKDSTQLAELKGKIAREESLREQQRSLPGHSQQGPAEPDPKASSKDGKQTGRSAHSTRQAPRAPASDLEDVRRSTDVI
jgi:hypothetical protein